ncbi:hypothetical protein EHN07_05225 [Buttiauxella warmboldiae]|uniref:GspL cytoplasmic actin-ATPase-like domain-containing protein n=1 Tax=Buttiauxella warmboldiae TaxID=82993 RepID=A0A3N5DQY7_9ENTR|nr:type II secretion system protein GspL [Buttiauxella warmboldiae]RPH29611.1 hypothetical protein EHN07_05225 [Buttiauxella warmboldiae]
MNEILLIRPSALAGESFYWLLQRGELLISQGFCDALPKSRPAQWFNVKQTGLLLPSADITFREVNVTSRKLPPLSWLVEESVPAQSGDMHWSLLNFTYPQATLAGCDKLLLLTWIERFQLFGFRIEFAVVDGLLLPWQTDELTLYAVEGNWWVRYKRYQALSIENHLLDPVLKRLPDAKLQYNEQFADDTAKMLAFLAPAVKESNINLLNDSGVQPESPWLKKVKYTTLGIISAAVLLLLLLPLFSAWRDHVARIKSDEKVLALWHTYILQPPVETDPASTFLQRTYADPLSFDTQIHLIDKLLSKSPILQLQGIEFQRQPWMLKLYLEPISESILLPIIESSRDLYDFSLSYGDSNNVILTAGRHP